MKPAKGAKVVAYRPVTGRPTNPDGTLRLVFEYQHPIKGKTAHTLVVDDPDIIEKVMRGTRPELSISFAPQTPVKPVRRIVRGAYHASDESPSSAPPQGSLI